MKRFFYGMMAAGLLLTSGCKDEASKSVSSDQSLESMSAEELAAAEEEAVRELALLLNNERANMPVADADFDELGDDMSFEHLSAEEQEQLAMWEAQADAWAKEEMQLAMNEAQQAGLEVIPFNADSSELAADQQEALQKNVEVARNLLDQGRDIIVQGHVNGGDDADQNFQLSEARANTVRDALVQAGLPADRIEAVAYADMLPQEAGSSSVNDRVDLALA